MKRCFQSVTPCRTAVPNQRCGKLRTKLCELNDRYNSAKYRALMQAMHEQLCLPHNDNDKPDGICLAQDNQTVTNLISVSQIFDIWEMWWVVKERTVPRTNLAGRLRLVSLPEQRVFGCIWEAGDRSHCILWWRRYQVQHQNA